MKPVLIIPIEIFSSLNISGYRFVLKIEDINHFQNALAIAKDNRDCLSILCDFNNIDIISLLKLDIKSFVNIYINCSFTGDILSLTKTLTSGVDPSNFSSTTFLLPIDTPNLVTLIKILSSCNFKSGIQLGENSLINENDFVELATYSYLAPVHNAQIEPFGYILQEVKDKRKYVDLNTYYFNAPDTFVYVEPDGSIVIKSEFSELQKKVCSSIEELSRIDYSEIAMEYKKLRFYNHFDKEDKCSKCSNFKVCSGFFKNRLENCAETMSSIYEMLF